VDRGLAVSAAVVPGGPRVERFFQEYRFEAAGPDVVADLVADVREQLYPLELVKGHPPHGRLVRVGGIRQDGPGIRMPETAEDQTERGDFPGPGPVAKGFVLDDQNERADLDIRQGLLPDLPPESLLDRLSGFHAAALRLPDPVRLGEVFLWQEERKVDKTGQLSLRGNRYEAWPRLAGRKVRVRYDPFDLSTVQVWADGQRFDARPFELVREHDQRVRPPGDDLAVRPRTGFSYLDLLLQRHEDEAREALGRIRFHRARSREDDRKDV